MVLSDEETKQFYEVFEELEAYLKKMKQGYSEGKTYKLIAASDIIEVNKLADQIHKIVYDNNQS